MELHELDVGHGRPDRQRHGHAVAGRQRRIRRHRVQLPGAAAGENDVPGPHQDRVGGRRAPPTRRRPGRLHLEGERQPPFGHGHPGVAERWRRPGPARPRGRWRRRRRGRPGPGSDRLPGPWPAARPARRRPSGRTRRRAPSAPGAGRGPRRREPAPPRGRTARRRPTGCRRSAGRASRPATAPPPRRPGRSGWPTPPARPWSGSPTRSPASAAVRAAVRPATPEPRTRTSVKSARHGRRGSAALPGSPGQAAVGAGHRGVGHRPVAVVDVDDRRA